MSGLTFKHHYSAAVGVRGEGKIIFLTLGFRQWNIVSVFQKVFFSAYSVSNSFSIFKKKKQNRNEKGTVTQARLFTQMLVAQLVNRNMKYNH